MDTEREFTPQGEPIWVGMTHSGTPISGRVIGYEWDANPAPINNSSEPPKASRARARVLVHGCNDSMLGPVVTIDANWPARYVDTAEEAWQAALDITAEHYRRMHESIDRMTPNGGAVGPDPFAAES